MDAHVTGSGTDYERLFALQDRMLLLMNNRVETGFYLTAGTCLNRFYFSRRFSDDLDFFTADNELFRDDVRMVLKKLKDEHYTFQIQFDNRDFVRIYLENLLKIDFVNDRVFRFGRTLTSEQGFRIDNLTNIAANKLSAIIGRDEPKDMFDLLVLFHEAELDWSIALQAAGKKSVFEIDYLLYRLQTFPATLLDSLNVMDPTYPETYRQSIPLLLQALKEAAVKG